MEIVDLNSWEDFEKKIRELEEMRVKKNRPAQFLFRGQSDHRFKLSTTLERNWKDNVNLKDYHHLVSASKPQIESFTGKNWKILSYPYSFDEWETKYHSNIIDGISSDPEFVETISFMTYLRHYGFPSPLLDWTVSPHVAAYFAFRGALPKNDDDKVSIYAFLESQFKVYSPSRHCIFIIGPYMRTDRRHFVQQCRYTICLFCDNQWQYASHERAFGKEYIDQKNLWKFNIPSSENLKALKVLDGLNINALSLFGSEESLMDTVAIREIQFRNRLL